MSGILDHDKATVFVREAIAQLRDWGYTTSRVLLPIPRDAHSGADVIGCRVLAFNDDGEEKSIDVLYPEKSNGTRR